jgi:thiamine-monophosphate kinase
MPRTSKVSDIGEFGLIERIAARLDRLTAVVGIGDDAAVLPLSGDEYLLATTDMLVEDVHFRREEMTPRALGRRALAVNLSDIAAMGGKPTFALTSIALPPDTSVAFVDELYAGLAAEARAFDVAIVGGNVTSTEGPISVDITLLGVVPRDEVALRSGARPGDALAVTGYLGNAAGYRLTREPESGRHGEEPPLPVPRVAEARALVSGGMVHAMLDVSDGLGSDAQHLARASGVGLVLYGERLPISIKARSAAQVLDVSALDLALYGGEDYELLIALPEDYVELARARLGKTQLAVIGTVLPADQGCMLERFGGTREPLRPGGWTHF